MNSTNQSKDGITEFILKAVIQGIGRIHTSNMATVLGISDDETKLNISIDSTKEELDDIPFITLQGGGSFLQFPIKKDDKCLIVFSKDTVEDWLGGEDNFIFSSDFDINNGFAIVGINNDINAIKIEDFTNFKVDKIKIQNENEELITVLSDTIQTLSDTSNLLSTTTVIIASGSSAGTYPISTQSDFISLKSDIDAIKTRLDTFKV